VNKRARQRLIGVTAILFVIIAAIVVGTTSGGGAGAYFATVDEVLADASLIGEKIKVSGAVVEGSWDRNTRPMEFDIRAEDGDDDSPIIHVVYDGTVPTTFGDGTTAIVTGNYVEEGRIESTEMIVKCPSKYESETGALTIAEAVEKADDIEFARIAGYVRSIEGDGVVISQGEAGGQELEVRLETALPDNVTEGTRVVVEGKFDGDVFVASEIAEASE
jgi:cytochrome c-type biogenesis protein CcmE